MLAGYMTLGYSDEQKTPLEMGSIYWYGHGVEIDYKKACDFFEKSAEEGDAKGQFSYANCYHFDQGRDKNSEEALYWFKEAMLKGEERPKVAMAEIYLYEHNDESKYEEAVTLLKEAYEKGDPNALFFLGTVYYAGLGVKKDYLKSLTYYNESAKRGVVLAQALVSHIFAEGLYDMPIDMEIADQYRDIVSAMVLENGEYWSVEYALSILYKEGWGVPRNIDKHNYYKEMSKIKGFFNDY